MAAVLRTPNIQHERSPSAVEYREVAIGDIYGVVWVREPQRTKRVRRAMERAAKYELQPFDVLLCAIGNVGAAAVVPPRLNGRWLASQSFFIIRFHGNRSEKRSQAEALYMFLESDLGRRMIATIATGGAIKTIPKKSFALMKIPQVDAELRKLAHQSFNQELRLHARIAAAQEMLTDIRASYLNGGEHQRSNGSTSGRSMRTKP